MESRHTSGDERSFAVAFDVSPLKTERILALATRAVEGAPALTAGEVRELAAAVLAHRLGEDSDHATPAS